MKLISWNVNGIRACLNKGFMEYFESSQADFFCLQETKVQAGQVTLELPGYHQFWNYAEKKGYSGTAIFAKEEPKAVYYGVGVPARDLGTQHRARTASPAEPAGALPHARTPILQRRSCNPQGGLLSSMGTPRGDSPWVADPDPRT